MRRGPTLGRSRRLRIGISHAATKQPGGPVVGRLLDTFDNDASGVSALQQFPTPYPHLGSAGVPPALPRQSIASCTCNAGETPALPR
jgi:hypothetical protein